MTNYLKGLQKTTDPRVGRTRALNNFVYNFGDWARHPTKKNYKELRKAYNAIYPICKLSKKECDCPWKKEAWKVNKLIL